MTREEIVEEIAESIYQYSGCVEEIVENTEYFLSVLRKDVKEVVHDKVLAKSIDRDEADKALKGLGWY